MDASTDPQNWVVVVQDQPCNCGKSSCLLESTRPTDVLGPYTQSGAKEKLDQLIKSEDNLDMDDESIFTIMQMAYEIETVEEKKD